LTPLHFESRLIAIGELRRNSVEVPLLSYPEPNKFDLRATEMKKYLKLILPILVILTLGFAFWQAKISSSNVKNQDGKVVQKATAVLKIGDVAPQSFDISAFVGKNALEATESKVKVTTNGEGVNAFVTSIGGREADTKKREFWGFMVNGSQAQVGAGSYIIQNNDEIQWKITNY
jgi:hypothetical protein